MLVQRPEGTALDRLERACARDGPPAHPRTSRTEIADARSRERASAARLARRAAHCHGRPPLGWLQLSDKQDGEFGPEDELLLVQLAQMASIAAENIFFDEAREANRLKDQFLATLSHELRTPLQTILTWACLLREEPAAGRADGMLARGLEVIERNARAQTRLIEDLLDVSRIVNGKLVLEKRRLLVGEMLRAGGGGRARSARRSAASS